MALFPPDYLYRMSDTELRKYYIAHAMKAASIEAKRGRIAAKRESDMASDARFVLRQRGVSLEEIKSWT